MIGSFIVEDFRPPLKACRAPTMTGTQLVCCNFRASPNTDDWLFASLHDFHLEHLNLRLERLPFRRLLVDFLHDIHSHDHLAKGREALAVAVPLAAEIQLRLIAD